jgi:methanogenic corrinoid protein MtbC1
MDSYGQQLVMGGGASDAGEHRADQDAGRKSWTVNACDGAEERLAHLAHTIENEIIPRLMLARRAAPAAPAVRADAATLGAEEVAELARLVLAHDAVVAAAYVEAMRTQGASLESLYLELLAPAARRLGELWDADLCDFSEVTLGLGRLQQVLRELSPAFRGESARPESGRRALLAPLPGDQHTFGLVMVAEFFLRAGWDVCAGPVATSRDLPALVRSGWFDVVGLSLGSEMRLDALATCIRSIRRASCNQSIGVMVGGPVFAQHPEYVALVGADATAFDGQQALVQAENLLALLARPA